MVFLFTNSNCCAMFDLSPVGNCSHEIKRHLLLGRKVMINLDSILKSRDITFSTKVCLVKAMVFPVVMYGCESWTIKKANSPRQIQQYMNCELSDVQDGFRKGRGIRDQIANICSEKKQESFRKRSTSGLLIMPKPLTVWITTNCGRFLN